MVCACDAWTSATIMESICDVSALIPWQIAGTKSSVTAAILHYVPCCANFCSNRPIVSCFQFTLCSCRFFGPICPPQGINPNTGKPNPGPPTSIGYQATAGEQCPHYVKAEKSTATLYCQFNSQVSDRSSCQEGFCLTHPIYAMLCMHKTPFGAGISI